MLKTISSKIDVRTIESGFWKVLTGKIGGGPWDVLGQAKHAVSRKMNYLELDGEDADD